ncbi:MAG: 1-deoxy-D-xylulose-5-phosphate synthase [Paludibacteraceae bacterium]|nr:1-deoxy-D-xylulose-5-phosphate synthase [Paludibacteraceae bacterium]
MTKNEKMKYLDSINNPVDLKQLPVSALPEVCSELRAFIIEELSHNPGHLGSSLGAIELTVALHYVFDTPDDRIVWDVGHQAYAHKILTGRRERFHTNRQFKGLAPFPTPLESEYDTCVCGHASNSISAALGMDVGEKVVSGQKSVVSRKHVVAVIGDGAMTGGLAFEGLNNTSMLKNDLLIVLNDNHMAIDPLKGGFTQYLLDITTSSFYNRWRWRLYRLAVRLHLMDETKRQQVMRRHNNLKSILTKQPNNIFQAMNIRYFGPADGHDVVDLVRILREIKNHKGPKVLHIITKKGKGYAPAEQDQTTWHAPGEFCVETGERKAAQGEKHDVPPLWQEVFGEELLAMAREDKRVVGVTPAMPSGCSMSIMQKVYPDRVFDVGIAEGHAVTFSAGMAKEGAVVFCNIYSSFLQRAYDNIIHDVAIAQLPVILCIDRAGIVGNDGATHHGLFDLAYLRPIPHIAICAPRTASDLRAMMRLAPTLGGPVAIRYPRGRSMEDEGLRMKDGKPICIGKGVCLREGKDMAVLSIGAIGNAVAEAIDLVDERAKNQEPRLIAHYDMRWLKPLDEELLREVGERFKTIVTVEDGVIEGGLGSAVLEWMADHGFTPRVIRLGVRDQFVEHGSTQELYHLLKLDKEGICESLLQALEK